eukprot:1278679-Amphidinium_carterae.1
MMYHTMKPSALCRLQDGESDPQPREQPNDILRPNTCSEVNPKLHLLPRLSGAEPSGAMNPQKTPEGSG